MKVVINDQDFEVDDRLANFEIQQKPSSYIYAFGLNPATNELFVQFNHGYACIYDTLSAEEVQAMKDAPSIGKFVISLKEKHPAKYIGNNVVQAVNAEQVLFLKHDIKGHKNNIYGKKYDKVTVISTGSNTYTVKNEKGESFTINHNEVLTKIS